MKKIALIALMATTILCGTTAYSATKEGGQAGTALSSETDQIKMVKYPEGGQAGTALEAGVIGNRTAKYPEGGKELVPVIGKNIQTEKKQAVKGVEVKTALGGLAVKGVEETVLEANKEPVDKAKAEGKKLAQCKQGSHDSINWIKKRYKHCTKCGEQKIAAGKCSKNKKAHKHYFCYCDC